MTGTHPECRSDWVRTHRNSLSEGKPQTDQSSITPHFKNQPFILRNTMAFVNEYISEDDVKKYGLDELMARFNRWSWREGRPEAFKHYWTVDRDRGIYLVLAKIIEDTGPSGRNEPTLQRLFILGWERHQIKVLLEIGDETSKKFYESPYRMVWKLIDIDASVMPQISRETVLQNLSQALAVFGSDGIRWQVPNTKVECRF